MSEDSFESKGVKIAFWISAIPTMILSGFCFSKIWLWFIVPLGVPAVGIAHAMGLMMIVAYVKTLPKNETTTANRVVKMWITAPIYLGIAFIIKLFM